LILAEHFAQLMATEMQLPHIPKFTKQAQSCLLQYAWPGNIRELKNVVERMVARSEEATIDEIIFDPFAVITSPERHASNPAAAPVAPATQLAATTAGSEWDDLPIEEAVDQLRIQRLRQALELHRFHQRSAAEHLGLTYHQFRGLYRKYEEQLTNQETAGATDGTTTAVDP